MTSSSGEPASAASASPTSAAGSAAIRFELTLDACLAAIEDAGLTVADIDGLSTYPGGGGGLPAGFSGAGAYDVIDALRLNVGWYGSGLETSGQLGSVINACLAVASGLANHVVCFRSVWEGSAQGDKGRSAVMPGGGSGGGNVQGVGFHGVDSAVLRAVGRGLDRTVRAARTCTSTARRASRWRGSR